jgi:ATP-dependent Clp protease ATP-binding subunit ClpA
MYWDTVTKRLNYEIAQTNEELQRIQKRLQALEQQQQEYTKNKEILGAQFKEWMQDISKYNKDIGFHFRNWSNNPDVIVFSKNNSNRSNYSLVLFPPAEAYRDPHDYGRGRINVSSLDAYLQSDKEETPLTFTAPELCMLLPKNKDLLNFVNSRFYKARKTHMELLDVNQL